MKRITVIALLICICSAAFAQQEIRIEDAAKHEGDSVTICTKIFGGRYFETSKNSPTLLNAGAKYPDAPLTIVIFGDSRTAFKNKPEEYYIDKQVCVTGKIVMYKDKPEIILTKEEQITVKE